MLLILRSFPWFCLFKAIMLSWAIVGLAWFLYYKSPNKYQGPRGFMELLKVLFFSGPAIWVASLVIGGAFVSGFVMITLGIWFHDCDWGVDFFKAFLASLLIELTKGYAWITSVKNGIVKKWRHPRNS